MSLPGSANTGLPKQGTNVYTVMLIISFSALLIAILLLALELARYGPGVPWAAGGS